MTVFTHTHNLMGHLHFRGEGHTTKTTLGSGNKNLHKFAIHGKHHNYIQDILDWHTENNVSLSSLKTSAGWSRVDKSLTDKFGKSGLATAFIDTIKKLEDATNKPAQFHEWRVTKTDTKPLTSNNWEYIRSNFRIDLQSETTAADQILIRHPAHQHHP